MLHRLCDCLVASMARRVKSAKAGQVRHRDTCCTNILSSPPRRVKSAIVTLVCVVRRQRSAAVFFFQPARRRRAEAKVKGRGGSEARKNVLRQARSRVHSVDEWTPGLRGQQQGGVHLRNMAFGPPLRSCHGSEGVGRQGGPQRALHHAALFGPACVPFSAAKTATFACLIY